MFSLQRIARQIAKRTRPSKSILWGRRWRSVGCEVDAAASVVRLWATCGNSCSNGLNGVARALGAVCETITPTEISLSDWTRRPEVLRCGSAATLAAKDDFRIQSLPAFRTVWTCQADEIEFGISETVASGSALVLVKHPHRHTHPLYRMRACVCMSVCVRHYLGI